MDITIKVIDNSAHRTPPGADRPFTGADWFFDARGDLQVRVSKLSCWQREVLLGLHEAIEAVLCKQNEVSQASVDAFDAEYQRTHAVDLNSGDEPDAPYRREHCFATAVERMLAAEMLVNWKSYDQELETL